jgi:uncharacterized repeat protein (TIGR03803 family)
MRGKELSSMMRGVLSIAIVTLTCVSAARAGTEEVLHTFMGVTQRGATPQGSLVADAAGNLYGTTLRGGAYGYGTVFEVTSGSDGKWKESVLYSFQNGNDGASPNPGLVFDAAGNLYGTSSSRGFGSVFELSPSSKGWTETTLYAFQGGSDGVGPNGDLVFDTAGNLYGTTVGGGGSNNCGCGVVFELTLGAGGQWTESVIHTFTSYPDGSTPEGGLVIDEDGNLYGTTEYGGTWSANGPCTPGCGVVFEMIRDRHGVWSEIVLFRFNNSYSSGDGVFPTGSLTLDASGNLYGAAGVIFRLSRGSWKEEILYDFSDSDPEINPNGGLVFDTDGNLYGTSTTGGKGECPDGSAYDGCGTVFQLSPGKDGAWKEHTLYQFAGQNDGGNPVGGVVLDSAGNLYGAASTDGVAGVGAIFRVGRQGTRWKESTVYGFTSSDGSAPGAGLVSDSEGNFYGTTSSGGSGGKYCTGECGTVFKLARDAEGHWIRSLLYIFKGGSDGASPKSGLIFDQAGNLYGTTCFGGDSNLGTVYKISNVSGHWAENVLYSFQNVADGGIPVGGVIFDAEGDLYGTTSYGGTYAYGTVYRLSPSSGGTWTKSVLYSFHGSSDGGSPNSGLIFDLAGNLYGTTNSGGENCSGYGCGVVFELSPSSGGWTETVLYAFTGASDGANPFGGLVFDNYGRLYGTTFSGGDLTCSGSRDNGCGAVFELSPGLVWTETVIHTFGGGARAKRVISPAFSKTNNQYDAIRHKGQPPKCDAAKRGIGSNQDGANPEGDLVFDSAGNLYGTTAFGGYSPYGCYYDGYGTVFELSSSSYGEWTEKVLYRFNGTDGQNPAAGVILDSMGNVYGTTQNGGDVRGSYYPGFGTVFEVTP